MAAEVKMPQLSDTMHSGKILGWKKKEGDVIARGDILAEVETEKANLEIESFHAGVLLQIRVPANTPAAVGDVIAVIGQPGEQLGSTAPAAAATTATPAPSAPAATPAAAPAAPTTAPAYSAPSSERTKASPLAKKIAADRNIDLSSVRGSGPDGRIVRKDVEQAIAAPAASAPAARPAPHSAASSAPAPTYTAPAPLSGSATLTPMTKMREVIARRMQESVTQSPHFYVTTSVNMAEAKRLYGILKERAEFKGISLNHLILKAVAYGIAHEPRVNRAVRDGMVYDPGQINLGIITAIEDGLLIPVIKDANQLPLRDLVFEARAAVERARAGRPSASDLTGGTFSISNMGMHDVENFTAIINPGQGSVLAVSSIKEVPVIANGAVVPGIQLKATVSVDHRIIDGLMAATFLKHFKEALETPALLML